jgi:hypothetical protein
MEAVSATPASSRLAWSDRLGQSVKDFFLSPRWLAILIVLVIWQIYANYRDTRLIPPPGRVFTELYKILATGLFVEELAASMYRIALGFGFIAISQSGCITKRTVTRDGVVVEQEMVVKRPFKDLKIE